MFVIEISSYTKPSEIRPSYLQWNKKPNPAREQQGFTSLPELFAFLQQYIMPYMTPKVISRVRV
jgi:hypothetical protein